MKRKKLLGKIYIKGLEQSAFISDLAFATVPLLRRKTMKSYYREANRIRKAIGLKPKIYYTVEKRKLVRVEP